MIDWIDRIPRIFVVLYFSFNSFIRFELFRASVHGNNFAVHDTNNKIAHIRIYYTHSLSRARARTHQRTNVNGHHHFCFSSFSYETTSSKPFLSRLRNTQYAIRLNMIWSKVWVWMVVYAMFVHDTSHRIFNIAFSQSNRATPRICVLTIYHSDDTT